MTNPAYDPNLADNASSANEFPAQEPVSQELFEIAKYQRGLIFCILFYLLAFAAQFLVPPQVRLVEGIGIVVVEFSAMVLVFLLANRLHGTASAIVLAALTLIPCIGLLVMLILNSEAAKTLRKAGLTVGYLGVEWPN